MKKIKSYRHFFAGVLTAALALACLGIWLTQGRETRFLIAAAIALAWSAVSFVLAFTRKSPAERAAEELDERDQLILLKSCRMTLQIGNGVVGGCCVLCLFAYGLWKLPVFLGAACALVGVLLLLLALMLMTNHYYEHRY